MGSTASLTLVVFLLWSLVDVHSQTIPYMDTDTRICTDIIHLLKLNSFESYSLL